MIVFVTRSRTAGSGVHLYDSSLRTRGQLRTASVAKSRTTAGFGLVFRDVLW